MALMYFVALKSSKLEKIQVFFRKAIYGILRKNLVHWEGTAQKGSI